MLLRRIRDEDKQGKAKAADPEGFRSMYRDISFLTCFICWAPDRSWALGASFLSVG